MRRARLTAIGWVFFTAALAGQTDPLVDTYRQAAATYQRGEFHAAADALLKWPAEDVKRAVAAAVREVSAAKAAPAAKQGADLDPKLRGWIEAAAMLHVELALRNRITTAPDVFFQIDLAETLVQSLPILKPGSGSSPPARDPNLFQQKWYVVASSFFLSWRRPDLASPLVDRGLRLLPTSADLRTLAGIVEESSAYIEDGNLHDRRSLGSKTPAEARQRLELAEGHYRRALSLDSEVMEAGLRLGRLLFLRREQNAARRELRRIETDTTMPAQRYLAHLFLGAVYESENDVASARREYEAALLLAPLCQTPYIALGFLERTAGRLTRSAELFAALTALPTPAAPDPWWEYKSGSFDEDAADWLRSAVAAPPS